MIMKDNPTVLVLSLVLTFTCLLSFKKVQFLLYISFLCIIHFHDSN